MNYDANRLLTDQARPSAEIWRTLMGVALVAALSFLLMTLWILAQAELSQRFGPRAFMPGATPSGLVWTLSTFLCPMLALALVMKGVHRRGLGSLLGPGDMFRDQFRRAAAVQVIVIAVALLFPSPGGLTPVANLGLSSWLAWLPVAVLMLVVQVSVEELFFRGYLQSQLAARFRSPLIWIVVPAALFAVLHLDSSAGDNRWPMVGVTFLFALAAGDLTARAGTLGPAIAMHLINNFASLMLVGMSGQLEGMALFVIPADVSDPVFLIGFALEALLILISWLAVRIALRR